MYDLLVKSAAVVFRSRWPAITPFVALDLLFARIQMLFTAMQTSFLSAYVVLHNKLVNNV